MHAKSRLCIAVIAAVMLVTAIPASATMLVQMQLGDLVQRAVGLHQANLAGRGEHLLAHDRIADTGQPVPGDAASGRHGARRDEQQLVPLSSQPAELIHQARQDLTVQRALRIAEYLAADLDDDSPAHIPVGP